MPDSVDRHVAHWTPLLPHLDPRVEGIVIRMWALTKFLNEHRAADLAAHGLERWQYQVLHHLAALGPDGRAAPSQLASWLDTHPATLTNRLDRLERDGYISRVSDPADRRRLLVALTDKGHRTWKSALRDVGAEEHQIVEALTEAEQAQLENMLRRMVLAVEDDAHPLAHDWPSTSGGT